MQACHAAARDAANQAEHARAAAEAAAAAVLSAKKSVGDASVSAEAQAQAKKAGETCQGTRAYLSMAALASLLYDTAAGKVIVTLRCKWPSLISASNLDMRIVSCVHVVYAFICSC